MLHSVLLLLSGNAVASLIGFARNLLIARMLGVEDYGIAVTFALSTALVEMASTIGLQKLIVQAREGDDPRWQAGLQGFHLLRGLLAAVLLFALAQPIALFFGVPELVWAYQVLALVPLFLGFEHFDIHRLTRHKIYSPILMYRILPLLASIIAIWPLSWFFGDYRVMLYALLIQWGLSAVVSHLMAERRYQLSLDRAILARAFSFGWPLLVNNALLFAVLEGDRVIVGREMGLELLAVFSIGLTLTRMPISVFRQSLSIFFLPRLSAAQADPARFTYLAHATMQASLASGLLLVLVVALIGGPIVNILFGEKYTSLLPFLIWFAIWQSVSGFRAGISQIALARGETRQIMLASVVRLVALPLAWVAAAQGAGFLTLLIIAALGEVAAFGAGLLLLRYKSIFNFRSAALPITMAFSFMFLVTFYLTVYENSSAIGEWSWERALLIFPFLIAIFAMKEITQKIRN